MLFILDEVICTPSKN